MTSCLKASMIAVAVGGLWMGQLAFAQGNQFDGKKFFDELSARGVKTEGFDREKFFSDLAARGMSSCNQMDTSKFFEELAARGVSVPPGFDSKKFFEEIAAKGVRAPDVVKAK